jgi:hypothetical protein
MTALYSEQIDFTGEAERDIGLSATSKVGWSTLVTRMPQPVAFLESGDSSAQVAGALMRGPQLL